MAGAMAGSAILDTKLSEELTSVTLTINNVCNLACSHCYLQYEGPNRLISNETVEKIFNSEFERLCIVGMEPLANKNSANIVKRLAKKSSELGIDCSIITNGLNGKLLDKNTILQLTWIDISIDSDEANYASYRKGAWPKLKRSIHHFKDSGAKSLRALHNISKENAHLVENMVQVSEDLGFDKIVFSPYLRTKSMGVQSVTMVPPVHLWELFKNMRNEKVHILLDSAYAEAFGWNEAEIIDLFSPFGSNFMFISGDPVNRGILRVTYDGLVMTALDAIHTSNYSKNSYSMYDSSLGSIYDTLAKVKNLEAA